MKTVINVVLLAGAAYGAYELLQALRKKKGGNGDAEATSNFTGTQYAAESHVTPKEASYTDVTQGMLRQAAGYGMNF